MGGGEDTTGARTFWNGWVDHKFKNNTKDKRWNSDSTQFFYIYFDFFFNLWVWVKFEKWM